MDAFDEELTSMLRQDGYDIEGGTLLAGLCHGLQPAGGLWQVARQAGAAGVTTGLLFNSWGTDTYPRRPCRGSWGVELTPP